MTREYISCVTKQCACETPRGSTRRVDPFRRGTARRASRLARDSSVGMQVTLDVQKVDAVFFLYCATLVFAMQIGFTLLEVGSVSIKNTKNVLIKNVVDLCVSGLAFYALGFGLMHGPDGGFAGSSGFAMVGGRYSSSSTEAARWHAEAFFSLAFASTSTTIVSGAVAERFSFQAYALVAALMSGLIFPISAHWVWNDSGWLSPASREPFLDVGVFDFAGSGVVHVVGGCSALLSVIVVGPRRGRFTSGRKPNDLPAQSPVFQVIGGLFLWYGWFGFNCGSVRTLALSNLFTVTRVGVCTVLSGCAGGLTTGLIDMRRNSSVIHPVRMINGVLTALVACSASSAYIEVGLSIVIGVVAGACYIVASQAMLRMKLDDVVDAAPIHLAGGVWGIIAGALMGKREYLMDTFGENYKGCGAFYGCAHAGQVFGAALIYVVVLISWTTAIILPTLLVLKRFNRLRVSVETEIHGLDVSQHGGASYSEFQTTIFKYKDASGTEKSMEMRVRAGDAARFAMILSDIVSTSDGGLEQNNSEGQGHVRHSSPLARMETVAE